MGWIACSEMNKMALEARRMKGAARKSHSGAIHLYAECISQTGLSTCLDQKATTMSRTSDYTCHAGASMPSGHVSLPCCPEVALRAWRDAAVLSVESGSATETRPTDGEARKLLAGSIEDNLKLTRDLF